MSDRNYTQFQYSLEKKVVSIFVTAIGAGAAAMTLRKWDGKSTYSTAGTGGYKGIKSNTWNGTGDITFTFTDRFNRLLDFSASVMAIDGSTTPLATKAWIKAVNPTASGGATVRVILYLNTSGTPVDPGTNDQWLFKFTWSDSSAQ